LAGPRRAAWSALAAAMALPAHGMEPAAGVDDADLAPVARVVVHAAAPLELLDRRAATASRLDLSVRETPATVDSVTAETMAARGYQSVDQAVDSLPGVSSGGAPGSPSQFSMRGFTGDQVTILRDGIYLGPADMTFRPQNTFNLASVDVLKGPGSVLYGQGSIAGTVNVVSKKAAFGDDAFDAIASYGRFNSSQVGVGGNKVLSPQLAVRADVSRTASHGFVDDAHADSTNATLSLLWKPDPRLDVELGLDYLTDHPGNYYGTPLVGAAFAGPHASGVVTTPDGSTVDRRLRAVNYNVGDAQISSTQTLSRAALRWRPVDGITIAYDGYYLDADRQWKNAESYTFNPATNRIDRDRFFVFHDQRLAGSQFSAAFDRPVAGFANQFVIGLAWSHLDFVRTRGFPDGDSVDPFQPVAGSFGELVGRRSPTRWTNRAVFMEDALDLTARLKIVGGVRAERFDLVRENYGPDGSFQAATSFARSFRPKNWRIGAVYQLTQDWAPYLQVSTGQDPVGANILLVNAGQNVDLSRSRQVEAGIKGDFDARRGSVTLAFYDIARKNLLTQTSAEVVDTAGMQQSRGMELALDYAPLPAWKTRANVAYTDASYRNFIDTSSGVDASGNRPANVPRWSANLWNSYGGVGGLPLELGAGVRYVGARVANTANTVGLKGYTLVDLYATWKLSRHLTVTGRINNATDKFHARWADVNYPGQIQLGAPISYEIGVAAHF
jgi:iron complex outermembrane receptor protein